jgi:hypothetical protein
MVRAPSAGGTTAGVNSVRDVVGEETWCLLSLDVDLESTSERLAASPARSAKDVRSDQAELFEKWNE